MTKEDLNKLREMTSQEIFKKYTPLLVQKKITDKQYNWLYSQAKDLAPEDKDIHQLLAAFGGRVEK